MQLTKELRSVTHSRSTCVNSNGKLYLCGLPALEIDSIVNMPTVWWNPRAVATVVATSHKLREHFLPLDFCLCALLHKLLDVCRQTSFHLLNSLSLRHNCLTHLVSKVFGNLRLVVRIKANLAILVGQFAIAIAAAVPISISILTIVALVRLSIFHTIIDVLVKLAFKLTSLVAILVALTTILARLSIAIRRIAILVLPRIRPVRSTTLITHVILLLLLLLILHLLEQHLIDLFSALAFFFLCREEKFFRSYEAIFLEHVVDFFVSRNVE